METLGPAKRIRRGFSRIGMALGCLVLVGGTVLGVVIAAEQYEREGQEFRRLACVLSESQKGSLYGEDFKWAATHTPQCGYFSEYGLYQKLVSVSATMLDHNGSGVFSASESQRLGVAAKALFLAVGIGLACALAVWGTVAAVGWAISGFARD